MEERIIIGFSQINHKHRRFLFFYSDVQHLRLFMVHMFVFSQEFALFSVGIILLQQRSNNSLFVGLNGGFMIDSKGLQMGQCHKKHRIVKPFASLLKKEEK